MMASIVLLLATIVGLFSLSNGFQPQLPFPRRKPASKSSSASSSSSSSSLLLASWSPQWSPAPPQVQEQQQEQAEQYAFMNTPTMGLEQDPAGEATTSTLQVYQKPVATPPPIQAANSPSAYTYRWSARKARMTLAQGFKNGGPGLIPEGQFWEPY
ncbi:hypothetical protein ACA910_002111 [Epithemia clementina (nom. ined.)]